MSTTNNTSGGIGFVGLLTIVFITLKLMGYIDWSWFWVLSPIWIIILGFILLIVFLVWNGAESIRADRNTRL